MKMNKTYNGWTNWETWNASLWVDNEYEAYKEQQRLLGAYSHRPDVFRDLYRELAMRVNGDITTGEEWARVNWGEICDSLIEIYEEENE